MTYALLIYAEEERVPGMSESEHEEFFAAYAEFNRLIAEAGVFVGAQRLQSSPRAVTARGSSDGSVVHTDGPFAETKESLAGFYLLECETPQEALEWAGRIPGVRIGCVEVRPVMADPMARE